MGASTNGIFHLFTTQAYVKLSFRFLFRKLDHIPQNNLFKTKEGSAVNFLGDINQNLILLWNIRWQGKPLDEID